MMNETSNKKSTYPGAGQPGSSDRLSVCSMIAGIGGLLFACCCFPSGLICGVFGITLALLARRAPDNPQKKLSSYAIIGIVCSIIAIALTFLVCYLWIYYYNMLKDPVTGPQLNEFMLRMQEYMQEVYGIPVDSVPLP